MKTILRNMSATALLIILLGLAVQSSAAQQISDKKSKLNSLSDLLSNNYNWGRVRIDRPEHPAGPYTPSTNVITLSSLSFEEITIHDYGIVSDLNGLGEEAFIFDKNAFKNITVPIDESIYIPTSFQPKEPGEYELILHYDNSAASETQTVLRGIGTVPRIMTQDLDFGETNLDDESDVASSTIRVWNLSEDEWEFGNEVRIIGFEFEPSGSVAEGNNYSELGFGYFPDNISITDINGATTDNHILPIILQPGEYLSFNARFAAKTVGQVQVKCKTISDAEAEVSSVWSGSGKSIGVNETNSDREGMISPNPVKSGGPVALKPGPGFEGPTEINLYDMTGKLCAGFGTISIAKGASVFELQIPRLNPGLYYFVLKSGDNFKSINLIVK